MTTGMTKGDLEDMVEDLLLEKAKLEARKIYEFTWSDRVDSGYVIVVAYSENEAREVLRVGHPFRIFILAGTHDLNSPIFVVTEECD